MSVTTQPAIILEGHGPHICRLCFHEHKEPLDFMVTHYQNVWELMVIERAGTETLIVKMERPIFERLADDYSNYSAVYQVKLPGHIFSVTIPPNCSRTVQRFNRRADSEVVQQPSAITGTRYC